MGANISAHRVLPDIRFAAADAKYSLVSHVEVETKSNDVLRSSPKIYKNSPFCVGAPPPNIFMYEKMNFLPHENVEIPENPAA